MKTERNKQTEEEIDAFVVAHAEDENAWDQPVHVVKKKSASVSIPASLADRAAFFSRIHREKSMENWLARIINERLDIEEAAFTGLKRDMFAKSPR
jgi:hypothetical protein